MARKEAPRIDPVSLLRREGCLHHRNSGELCLGRFWTDKGIRVQSAVHATQFGTYEEAHEAILRNCLRMSAL